VIPADLVAKYSRERVLKFLRRLVNRGGRALVSTFPLVLDLELYGLVIIPGHRQDAARVQITDAGRAVAALDGWTKPAPKGWQDTPEQARMCPACCGRWHGGTPCTAPES
jgi:hypothetical protein